MYDKKDSSNLVGKYKKFSQYQQKISLTGACFPGNPLEGQGLRHFYINGMLVLAQIYVSEGMARVSSGPPPICSCIFKQWGVGSKKEVLEDLSHPQDKSLLLEKQKNEVESTSLKVLLLLDNQMEAMEEKKEDTNGSYHHRRDINKIYQQDAIRKKKEKKILTESPNPYR